MTREAGGVPPEITLRDQATGSGALCRKILDALPSSGVEFLQVKTLSEKRPDPNYDKTRQFYLAQGFRPLEEFPTLWDPANPALQLIKSLPHPDPLNL